MQVVGEWRTSQIYISDCIISIAFFRAVARFFVTGGIIASAEGRSLVGGGGSGGILPENIFKFGSTESKRSVFSTCHDVGLRKIEYEIGKQLQVNTIKITESKENKSIH